MALKLPAKCPVVILPGFGNDARDYTNPLDGGEDKAFASALERRGLKTFVVPVERSDWLKVASAVLTLDFWKGTCRPDGPAYSWYLQKVKETVRTSLEETGADKVLLVGHSAGGWLARATLAEGVWEEGVASEDVVAGLVTLGSPHFAGPMDMTRGALTFTSDEYPGAFLKDRGIFYVTVGGAALLGEKDAPRRSRARFAYGSYQTVCGEGGTMGDSCVPLVYAHLEGAEQVTLDGVFHSVDKPDEWYGSEGVVDRWLATVAQELRPSGSKGDGIASFSDMFSVPFAKLFS
ncbi:conserved unknown protein [Ectocarpus siliculosus]|uniref:AB hydrolase-1 domain-containing protein n=1 Tax=Ectocarpus siliculosus TaxID=2880 RepID=D7FTL3_ECTSI|nr:conserved unknown protein [Ectocarpus siliculosus]|eukprot:CBJ31404.1 conserved unknown protein [Ectocarpus siliculosus]